MEKNNKLLTWLKNRWFIVLILLFSLAIRIYKIDSNLPNIYWHDENNYIETALRFGTGNFRPHTFQHGTAFSLMLCAEYILYYTVKAITIRGYSLRDFMSEYVIDPTNFYLIGRVTAALFGVGCILLLYLIALRLYNRRTASIASLFFSLSLSPLMESRQANTEPIAAFFLLLAFLTAIPIFKALRDEEKKRTIRYYILSAFFIGLATAVKLYAAFGFCFLLLAHFFGCENKAANITGRFIKCLFSGRLAVALFFLIIGFIIVTPYILIDPHFFFASITQMRQEMTDTTAGTPWAVYFKEHVKNAVGSGWLSVLIFISCIYSIAKPAKEAVLLLAYPIAFYLFYMRYHGFAHYLIPAISFLFIIAAAFLDTISGKILKRRNYFLIVLIISITAAPCFLNMIRYLAVIAKPDTRTIARDWIEKNIPSDSSILSEGYIKGVAVQVPQIKSNVETLRRDLALVKSNKGNGHVIATEIEYAKDDTKNIRYDISKTQFMDADTLKKARADYVILSGYIADMFRGERAYLVEENFYIKRKALHEELDSNYVLLKKISPYPEWGFAFPKFLLDDFKKLENINILKDIPKLRQGPEITIFCRKTIRHQREIGLRQ